VSNRHSNLNLNLTLVILFIGLTFVLQAILLIILVASRKVSVRELGLRIMNMIRVNEVGERVRDSDIIYLPYFCYTSNSAQHLSGLSQGQLGLGIEVWREIGIGLDLGFNDIIYRPYYSTTSNSAEGQLGLEMEF
jgi:hypothetical protein